MGHEIDVVGEVLPRPGDVRDAGLPAERSLGADLAGDPGDLVGEHRQGVDHGVDGVGQGRDLALGLDGDLPGEVAAGDGGRHVGHRADLAGEVGGHHIDVVGEVLPGAGHAPDGGLAAEVALGADVPGHPGHLVGERGQLVDHRVDGLLQLQDLAAGVDPDLLRQIALGDRGGHRGDGADLRGEVVGHDVDGLGEVAPGAGDVLHVGLPAEAPLGADLAGDPGDLARERAQLVDHGVDGVLEFEDLAARVDGDLLREVAVGHRGGDLGDRPDLAGQVAGHGVHRVGEVAPRPRDALHIGLAAEDALGADLAGDPGDLAGEAAQLVDHGVDGVLELQDLAARVDGDLLREVALRDRGGHLGDVPDLGGEVAGHRVDRVGEVGPRPRDGGHLRLTAEPPFGAHLPGHPGHLGGEAGQLVDHAVEHGRDLAEQTVRVVRQPGPEVPVAHRRQTGEQEPQFRHADLGGGRTRAPARTVGRC